MASRRFFTYDPYDYYYASPYHHYAHPYYHQYQKPAPAPSGGAAGFFDFPAAAPEPASAAPRPRVESSRPVSIPVRFVGSHPEPERVPPPPPPRRRAPSAEEAAVRVQAAARGFLARRSVRAVREVEREAEAAAGRIAREAEAAAGRIAREAEALRGDATARIAVGEALMRMLLRLDAVRGAREYRRRVTKRVLALQDAVDALDAKTAPAPEKAVAEDDESEVTAEMADETAVASKLPDAAADEEIEGNAVDETAAAAAAAAAEMELDAERGDGEPDEANLDGDRPEGSDPAGEWEMVTEEPQSAAEPAGTEIREAETGASAGAGAGDGGVDTRKVMEMVAALCERSAQQCAVIGALAERVDALERAVRRAEDAERRRRRAKKLRKEDGKGSNHSKCYSD